MRRDEDGFNAGARRFGALCLSLIPWALGVGAAVWFGLYLTQHYAFRQMDIEQRAAEYVGAKIPIKEKIKVKVKTKSCIVITRAVEHGDLLEAYFTNTCGVDRNYLQMEMRMISPDGTVLKSDWRFITGSGTIQGPDRLLAGEKGAARWEHGSLDARAAAIEVEIR